MTNKGSNSHQYSQVVLSFHVIVVLLLMTVLSSCSHHVSRPDGPPDFYVDETKVQNAVPKPEPLAKYGNMNSYRVFGKRYYTMKSSKNYEATGIASWYGKKFHARNTSSGEPYNMLGMTAAHKTLPLPTYVEVTNLRNERKIIVKVNDRGPFESNRLIDLSYVAAKKLGIIGHGTALVKIKAIDPYRFGRDTGYRFASRHLKSQRVLAENKPVETSWKPVSSRSVYLQVGAFRNKIHADRLQQRLLSLLSAPVKIARPSANKNLYRVQVGPIKNNIAANKIYNQLKELGIKSSRVD